MNKTEYIKTQISLLMVCGQATSLDLDGFLAAISNAETVSPIVDPTLYMRASANLKAVKKLAEALKEVQRLYQEMKQTAIHTAVAEFERSNPDGPGAS